MLPSSDYLALSRKSSEWTPSDEWRQQAIIEAVVQMIPQTLTSTCFGVYFPQYVRDSACANQMALTFTAECAMTMGNVR